MAELQLQGRRILVVEDEYLIADDMREALTAAGAEVLGPVPSVGEATALLEREPAIDAALLDVNLNGEMVFAVADLLVARRVPFVFATGYDRWGLPDRFADVSRLEKPIRARDVAAALKALILPAAS